MGENIYKRKDGRYEGRYLTLEKNGVKKYCSIYGKSKSEVKEKLKKVQAEQQYNANIGKIPFGVAAKKWLETKRECKITSYETYEYVIEKQLKPYFDGYTIGQITMEVKQKYVHEKEEHNYSAVTIRTHMQILERVVNFYKEENEIKFYDNQKKEVAILSNYEWEVLKAELLENPDNIKLGILILCYTGLKIGELCALEWKKVDFESGTILIDQECQRIKGYNGEKTATRLAIVEGKRRLIYMPEKLRKTLSRKKYGKEKGFILSGTEKMLEPRTVQYSLKSLAKKLEINNLSPNVLRNTFAVWALEKGVNSNFLASMLGIQLEGLIKYIEMIEANPLLEIQKLD